MATFGTSNALQNGVRMMQEDHDNGARILATNAVKVLGEVLSELAVGRITLPYLWHSLCLAGWKLKGARPSMDAAIGGALVQTLMAIKEAWLVECKVDNNMLSEDFTTLNEQDLTKLKDIATSAIDLEIQRRVGDTRMARMFMLWLEKKVQELGERPVRILTLSCSSTMKKCLEVALREMPDFRIELRIMESRPLCEGAVLASSLSNVFHSDGDRNRLSIQVEPDSAVAILAKDIDVVLLGADRITSSGDVSNKMGSLAATICAKTLSPNVKVLVVAERDKIAGPGDMHEHAIEENDRIEVTKAWGEKFIKDARYPEEIIVRNAYFEWVPAKWIDGYISESGVLDKQSVMDTSLWARKREEELFSKFYTLRK